LLEAEVDNLTALILKMIEQQRQQKEYHQQI